MKNAEHYHITEHHPLFAPSISWLMRTDPKYIAATAAFRSYSNDVFGLGEEVLSHESNVRYASPASLSRILGAVTSSVVDILDLELYTDIEIGNHRANTMSIWLNQIETGDREFDNVSINYLSQRSQKNSKQHLVSHFWIEWQGKQSTNGLNGLNCIFVSTQDQKHFSGQVVVGGKELENGLHQAVHSEFFEQLYAKISDMIVNDQTISEGSLNTYPLEIADAVARIDVSEAESKPVLECDRAQHWLVMQREYQGIPLEAEIVVNKDESYALHLHHPNVETTVSIKPGDEPQISFADLPEDIFNQIIYYRQVLDMIRELQ